MMNTMTVADAAQRWGISERRIAVLCKEGRIKGAYKQGKSWVIPADAQRPADARIKSGSNIKSAHSAVLRLPVGVSVFTEAVSNYYYIDKTLLLKDYLDDGSKVTLYPSTALRQNAEHGYAAHLL